MAKLMTGLYADSAAAKRVVYDLLNNGVARHAVVIIDQHGININDKSVFDEDQLKAKADEYARELEKGRVLILAWTFKPHIQPAAEAMNRHKPLAFSEERMKGPAWHA